MTFFPSAPFVAFFLLSSDLRLCLPRCLSVCLSARLPVWLHRIRPHARLKALYDPNSQSAQVDPRLGLTDLVAHFCLRRRHCAEADFRLRLLVVRACLLRQTQHHIKKKRNKNDRSRQTEGCLDRNQLDPPNFVVHRRTISRHSTAYHALGSGFCVGLEISGTRVVVRFIGGILSMVRTVGNAKQLALCRTVVLTMNDGTWPRLVH